MHHKGMSGTSTVELARVVARECLEKWLGDKFGEDPLNKLVLDSTVELDSALCTYLDEDEIKLDGNLPVVRLSADPCAGSSWDLIKYRCQLANESECFYRLKPNMQDQWLRTVIRPQKQTPDVIEICSNVVPRQAYLTKLAGMNATRPGHGLCTGGFSPISVLREAEPYRQSCAECALAKLLRGGAYMDAGSGSFWDIAIKDERLVAGHAHIGEGTEGDVYKIEWRKGFFARKEFKNVESYEMELNVASEVSHPNIVHCFGSSERIAPSSGDDILSLYMEFLEESLESRLQEAIQKDDPFSFRDILDVLWQVAEAMKHMHERNFVHGDLKPCNILLSRLAMPHSESGTFYLVKVSDFGRAQRVDSSGDFSSKIGTAEYTAPEVWRCRRGLGPPPRDPLKIDVYSFGVLAYQVLTRVSVPYSRIEFTQMRDGVMNDERPLRPDFGLTLCSLDRDCRSLLPPYTEMLASKTGTSTLFPSNMSRITKVL